MLIEMLNPGATFLVICALLIGFGLGVMVSRRLVFRQKMAVIEKSVLTETFRTLRSSSWHNDLGGI